METFDLSDVFHRMESVSATDDAYTNKAHTLKAYTDFSGAPTASFDKLVKLSVVMDGIIEEAKLDAVAVRCWLEMQQVLNISPCVVLSEMNNRMMTAACEVDVGNAVAMHCAQQRLGRCGRVSGLEQ